jgi:hypothetical protein
MPSIMRLLAEQDERIDPRVFGALADTVSETVQPLGGAHPSTVYGSTAPGESQVREPASPTGFRLGTHPWPGSIRVWGNVVE